MMRLMERDEARMNKLNKIREREREMAMREVSRCDYNLSYPGSCCNVCEAINERKFGPKK